MALNYVVLTLDLYDGQGNPVTKGTAMFTPSAQLTDTTDHELITQLPIVASFHVSGSLPVVKLLATDNGAPLPLGWAWSVSFDGMTNAPAAFSFFLPFTSGSSQYLSAQVPVFSVVTMAAYLPIDYPPGAVDGYVWTTDADGNGSWQAPGLQPSGDTSGATDTANIQGLMNLAGGAILQAGTFYTNAPLTGTILKGAGGCTPSIYDGNPPAAGTIIKPVAAWSAGAVSPAGVVVINGPGARLRDFWIDGTLLWSSLSGGQIGTSSTPAVTADGINDGSGFKAAGLHNVGVYGSTNHGILNGGGGWHLSECLANICWSDGFSGPWTDSEHVNGHGQTCGLNGTGSAYFISGGESKFIGCRGDLSQVGFTIDAFAAATFVDMVELNGCSSQRNNHYGVRVKNGSGSGQQARMPVHLVGFISDGDGINGTVVASGGGPGGTITGGTGGGGFSSVRVEGQNAVVINGMMATVNTRDVAGGCPQYSVSTAASGTGPGVPVLVAIDDAFLNAETAFFNDAAPSAMFLTGVNVAGFTGGIYQNSAVTQAAPSLLGTASGNIAAVPAARAAGSTGKAADAGHVHAWSLTAPAGFAPSNPTGTVSATLVMMGLGASADQTSPVLYTPLLTGLVKVDMTFQLFDAAAVNVTAGGRYGALAGAATTVAAGSNGGEISAVASWSSPSAGVLDVASTAGYATSGTLFVATSSTPAIVTYTGIAAGQFTGCAYVSGSATGTVATGGIVSGAPLNGVPVTGTRFGPSADYTTRAATTSAGQIASITALLSLTPGTAYWFDLALLAASANSATAQAISAVIQELP